jgi:hypothetical protein
MSGAWWCGHFPPPSITLGFIDRDVSATVQCIRLELSENIRQGTGLYFP